MSSVPKELKEIADRIRKEVESLSKPGEKWSVTDGPRITVSLFNPRNPGQGRGHQINASNCDDIASVMESLRSEWETRARDDDEYTRALLEKCGPRA